MDQILIYLWNDHRGVKKSKCNVGYIVTMQRGQNVSLSYVGDVFETDGTAYTAEVKALAKAALRIKQGTDNSIAIRSNIPLLREAVYQLRSWKKDGWTRKGKPLAMADKWKEIETHIGSQYTAEPASPMDPRMEVLIERNRE